MPPFLELPGLVFPVDLFVNFKSFGAAAEVGNVSDLRGDLGLEIHTVDRRKLISRVLDQSNIIKSLPYDYRGSWYYQPKQGTSVDGRNMANQLIWKISHVS